MKTNLTSTTTQGCGESSRFTPALNESTYAFLVRSEDKGGVAMEALAYLLCIVCAVVSMSHFARQPVATPATIRAHAATRVTLTTAAIPERS